MEAIREASADGSGRLGRSLATDVGTYIALAFGFSWVVWVGAIKLGLREEFLNIGTAGPAVAAVILSQRRQPDRTWRFGSRWLWFVVLLAPCWIVISLYYLWRGGNGLQFRLDPLLLAPALFPAWILSEIFATDEAVRSLLRRLVHPPNRWSVFALLYFPFVLGLPTAVAHTFGARIVWPPAHGSVLATISLAMSFFLFNLLFVATLEELGWRGFLLDRLQHKFSPLSASFLVWLPWALWHAPLDHYRPGPFSWTEYVLLRVVFLIPLTVDSDHRYLPRSHEYFPVCGAILPTCMGTHLRFCGIRSDCGSDVVTHFTNSCRKIAMTLIDRKTPSPLTPSTIATPCAG